MPGHPDAPFFELWKQWIRWCQICCDGQWNTMTQRDRGVTLTGCKGVSKIGVLKQARVKESKSSFRQTENRSGNYLWAKCNVTADKLLFMSQSPKHLFIFSNPKHLSVLHLWTTSRSWCHYNALLFSPSFLNIIFYEYVERNKEQHLAKTCVFKGTWTNLVLWDFG